MSLTMSQMTMLADNLVRQSLNRRHGKGRLPALPVMIALKSHVRYFFDILTIY